MASLIYNIFREKVMTGEINFATDSVRCMLMSNLYTIDETAKDSHLTYVNVASWEISGMAGYTAGGKEIPGVTVQVSLGYDYAQVWANEVVWIDSTITASSAILYRNHGDPTQRWLIACYDFNAAKSSRASDFIFQPAPYILFLQ